MECDRALAKESLKFLNIVNDTRALPDKDFNNLVAMICDQMGWNEEDLQAYKDGVDLLEGDAYED
jgi:hypothetical protein